MIHHRGPGASGGGSCRLSHLLIDFLKCFEAVDRGWKFSIAVGIERIPESETSFDPLFVEDPLQAKKNAAQNCFRITAIKAAIGKALKRAERLLEGREASACDDGQSLLEKIF